MLDLERRFQAVRCWAEQTLSVEATPEATPYSWLLIEDQHGLEVVGADGVIEVAALSAHFAGGDVEWGAWINYRREGPHPRNTRAADTRVEVITAYVRQRDPANSDVRRAHCTRCPDGFLRLAAWEPTV